MLAGIDVAEEEHSTLRQAGAIGEGHRARVNGTRTRTRTRTPRQGGVGKGGGVFALNIQSKRKNEMDPEHDCLTHS